MEILNYFFKDKVSANYYFDNGWHMASTYRDFKCKKNLTNDEVIAEARKKCGWRLTYVNRNGVEIYPKK